MYDVVQKHLRMILKITFLILVLLTHNVLSNETLSCDHKDDTISYINIDVEMKTETNYSSIPSLFSDFKSHRNITLKPMDCADIYEMGFRKSAIYTIWPVSRLFERRSLDVYCDMSTDGGGWTLIQRRGDFGRRQDYFFKGWRSYKEGFGDIERDFWMGNDNIFALTNQKLYSARFDLKDVEGTEKHAMYEYFWIDDESNKYSLHISDYSGDAGDSMTVHNNVKFTTNDQDNDKHGGINCALVYKGAWWYTDCHSANLNALYLKGAHESHADGVNWHSWKGYKESLESTEIKIRPKNF